MTPLTLDQLVDRGVKYARSVLIGNKNAQLLPFFHIQFNDRTPGLIATPWSNDEEKQAAISGMRAVMRKFRSHIVNYMFMSEAWVATESLDHPIGLMPRDREDKREAVIINAFDAKEHRFCVLEIKRDDKGRVSELLREDNPYQGMEGRLHNLLEDP